jgi:PAS domain S-box-containing protein
MSSEPLDSDRGESGKPTLLYVESRESRIEAIESALEQHGIRVVTDSDPLAAVERLDERDIDCLLASADLPSTGGPELVEAVRERDPELPVVLLVPDPSEEQVDRLVAAGTTEYIGGGIEAVSYARIADRVRATVAQYRSRQAQRSERAVVDRLQKRLHRTEQKVTSLHSVAMQLNSTSTVEGVYREMVDAAERILDLDICFAFAVDEDAQQFVPRASSSVPTDQELQPVPIEENVMAETYRTGRSDRVVDMDLHPDISPDFGSYRSGISVAIGSFGVFQAVSKQPGAFDRIDVELVELLTSHAAAALQRLAYERELRTERDHYAALFDNSSDCIVRAEFVDGEPVVRSVNPVFESTFGYEEHEIVGRSIDDIVVSEDRREEAATLTEQVHGGDFVQAEVRRRTRDGFRDFLLRSVPLNDDALYAVYTDITERKQAERAVERRNERLDRFASVVSHDLRNPLNVAEGRLELAREECDSEHLEPLARAHERMGVLIDDMLALARAGERVGDIEALDLGTVAETAWENVDTDAATLTVETTLELRADRNRLQQLFENLFRNSVEHGSEGSRSASNDAGEGATAGDSPGETASDAVTVTAADLADGAGFYVADDGPGIPGGPREQVFESGFSTTAEGTGFGLAIVDEVASAHGWTVSVTESTDGGARFEFRDIDESAVDATAGTDPN